MWAARQWVSRERLSHNAHGIPCCVHIVDLGQCLTSMHCARHFGQKNGPEGPFFTRGAIATQAATPFAFSTYSSIWLKFKYL
jgi:hypothetical protein